MKNQPSLSWIILAFAIVYVVWGSTYFFIKIAVTSLPPLLLGTIRYSISGFLLLTWCSIRGEHVWSKKDIFNSAVSGMLLLGIGTGTVFWAEQFISSAVTAIIVSANPIWLAVLDRPNWKTNFQNKYTLTGIILGFVGVLMLFWQGLKTGSTRTESQAVGLILLFIGPIGWSAGSLYSKKHGSNTSSVWVTTGWQMLTAGLAFLPCSYLSGELTHLSANTISLQAWLATFYLILFGSIAAFSAYVWLLQHRPATQVGATSYVNPVIAVLLGMMFGGEHILLLQLIGLVVILLSVLLINMSRRFNKLSG